MIDVTCRVDGKYIYVSNQIDNKIENFNGASNFLTNSIVLLLKNPLDFSSKRNQF